MNDQIVCFAIGGGHLFRFEQRINFLLDQERAVIVREQNRAGIAGEFGGHLNLVIQLHAFSSTSSSRAVWRTVSKVISMSARVVRKFMMHARRANLPRNIAFERYACPPRCTRCIMRSFSRLS